MKISIRNLLLLTIIVGSAMPSAILGDDPPSPSGENIRSRLFGKDWISTITDDALRRSPSWDTNSENPPVSAKKAMKLSREVAERIAKDDKALEGWECQLDGATLRKSADGKHWFWNVRYIWTDRLAANGNGVPPHANIIVLMDGKAIEPHGEDDGLVKAVRKQMSLPKL